LTRHRHVVEVGRDQRWEVVQLGVAHGSGMEPVRRVLGHPFWKNDCPPAPSVGQPLQQHRGDHPHRAERDRRQQVVIGQVDLLVSPDPLNRNLTAVADQVHVIASSPLVDSESVVNDDLQLGDLLQVLVVPARITTWRTRDGTESSNKRCPGNVARRRCHEGSRRAIAVELAGRAPASMPPAGRAGRPGRRRSNARRPIDETGD